MRMTHLMIAVVSMAIVLTVVVWEWENLTAPGSLHASHQNVAELQGRSGCRQCHGQDLRNASMSEACDRCHGDIGEQIASGRGLHGSLSAAEVQVCGACHIEHAGDAVALVSSRAFEAAGVFDERSYDHRFARPFDLHGRHAELTCERCHDSADKPRLNAGERRYLGLSQQCATCHSDAHHGTFGSDCVSCHGQMHAFDQAADFVHTPSFPLLGGHGGLACASCHDVYGPASIVALRSIGNAIVPRACVACHSDPHEGNLGSDCDSCHGTEKPFDQVAIFEHTAAFPLVASHSGHACKDCHAPGDSHSVAALKEHRLPVRDCAACHRTPHRASTMSRLATMLSKADSQTCSECHRVTDASFVAPAATMSPGQHAATGFTLDAPHDKAQCVDCHATMGTRQPLAAGPDLKSQFAELYPGRTQRECASCHQDPHRGQFDDGPTRGRCIDCHSSRGFIPCQFDIDDHSTTLFPLTGAHQAVACALCHKPIEGTVQFVSTPTSCAACHQDVHEGRFDREPKKRLVNGQEGCARCHRTSSFGDVAWNGVDHGSWTGHVLEGAHARAGCEDCHQRRERPDAHGRTLGLAPTACGACHADRHAGQFSRGAVTDCARCHVETASFKSTTFDHQRDSAFTLDEHHIKLDCTACHKAIEIAPQVHVVRYRPLGTRCQDCHDPGLFGGKERP